MEICFTDGVIEEIAKTIGTRTPETGGALFGPENSNLVSSFVFDEKARTTAVTYTPSTDLIRRIPKIETGEGVVFKGVIHSHPPGVDRPSGPDLSAFRRTLNTNPRLHSLITPIVNLNGGSAHGDAHRLNEVATMRVFQVFRSNDRRPVACEPATVFVTDVDAVTRCVAGALQRQEPCGEFETTIGHELINGHVFVRCSLLASERGAQFRRLDFYFAHQFPLVAPLVSVGTGTDRRWLALPNRPNKNTPEVIASHIVASLQPSMKPNPI